ncbi:hypothetical protein D2E59_09145 [Mycobacteroides abscessus]|uniref:Uncharacterized protein n=3 Tax=Mycobacteroides abscessus TaxID=36809 RepID=A0ABD7HII2_9MYCO|nr:DUF5994 family protein [Mycobacteroides abscessus]AWG65108.1 hypothetical protein DDT46_15755 [Mycobacteroides abscessus]PVA77478.1 hypothetical protein DDJ37_02015 [Mycobacteroides abscessus]PVB18934.1 hypothetical protein DDJ40_03660 [Mycobacteroides abscessus]PVB23680.1 hypothetical protein DDJ71_01860 [Mycobacteroides abscessus]PVB25928.1 hypothetical protein DDJ45_16990 [Mycobacteroides abscessus]
MTQAEYPGPPVRFTLGPHKTGRMNGAWWPQDDGLIARELSPLVDELSDLIGAVHEASLNWKAGSPRSIMTSVALPPPLAKRPFHWVIALRGELRTIRMLVVPARTNKILAWRIMRLAAQMSLLDSSSEEQVAAARRIVMSA